MRPQHSRRVQSQVPERSVLWARLILLALLGLFLGAGYWLRGLDLGQGGLAGSMDPDAAVDGTPALKALALRAGTSVRSAESESESEPAPDAGSASSSAAGSGSTLQPGAGPATEEGGSVAAAERPGSAPSRLPFEEAPGVLSVSIRTLRQASIKDYPTESVGSIALGLEDLRLRPVKKGGGLEVNLAERLTYEGTDDGVPKQSRRLLDGIGRLLAEDADTRVRILVHTDDEGDAGFNLRLSQRRADALKEYLVGRGIAAERIEAMGRGEDAPLVASKSNRKPSRSERAKNRRVELVVEPLDLPDTEVGTGTTLTATEGAQSG